MALSLAGGIAVPPAIPAPDVKPTLQGRSGHYRATIVVFASPIRAWAVLTDYQAMPGLMPDIKEARVVRRNGSNLQIQQTYQAPYTFGQRIQATLAMQEKPPRQLSYQLIKGDQLRDLRGTWTITHLKKGVLLSHQMDVDPVVPAFVRPLYDELTEANLLQSMRILKRLMESSATFPSPG